MVENDKVDMYRILNYIKKFEENGSGSFQNHFTESLFDMKKNRFYDTLELAIEKNYVKGIDILKYKRQRIFQYPETRLAAGGRLFLEQEKKLGETAYYRKLESLYNEIDKMYSEKKITGSFELWYESLEKFLKEYRQEYSDLLDDFSTNSSWFFLNTEDFDSYKTALDNIRNTFKKQLEKIEEKDILMQSTKTAIANISNMFKKQTEKIEESVKMTDYEKLKKLYDEIDELIAKGTTGSLEPVSRWYGKTERFLKDHCKECKTQFESFDRIYFLSSFSPENSTTYKENLGVIKDILEECLEKICDSKETDLEVTASEGNKTDNFKSVFIVHGRDEGQKEAVARMIEKQGIKAIILHELPNQGATIIEKFETHSDVSAVVALFTDDDIGHLKTVDDPKPRARQNVVFETGFFIGKLGRKKVILIAEKGIELPSDLQGILYTDQTNWKFDVLSELDAIGFSIDYRKLKNC